MAGYDIFVWLNRDNPYDHTGYLIGSLTTEQVVALGPILLKVEQAHGVTLPFIGNARLTRAQVRAVIRILEEDLTWQGDARVRAALEAALSTLRIAVDLHVGILWATP